MEPEARSQAASGAQDEHEWELADEALDRELGHGRLTTAPGIPPVKCNY